MHKLYNALTTQLKKRFRVPGFGTGSGILEPVPCNRFLRQITSCKWPDISTLVLLVVMGSTKNWWTEYDVHILQY